MESDKKLDADYAEAHLACILAEIRARGQRVTPQRVAIIRNFLNRSDHPSADGVYNQLRAGFPMMAWATV